ncbi:GntR family transcriptional regulator [Streptomyces sp. NWU339]|uniref:GntR family transcriptional regulator n=1 Tax=Streptomyces sp. NWU339 TaxID=2185284 RepID=UPI000D684558|nr:GntR family transcriptional regulator [Streptomyces sp. NWU339]PWI08915.1 GntR family transcriptional regulator [Streptomyces sp. NWU339]
MPNPYVIRADARSVRQQLPEEVASYVRELIISGEARPGDFLRMEPIAEAVGVSNTPVREGLLALRSEGFVKLVPRKGFVVEPFTRQDVRDLFWAQATLAGELAARAAEAITPVEIAQLEAIGERYKVAVGKGDDRALAELGHQFHRTVNKVADSHRLALLLGSVVKHLSNTFYTAIEGQVEQTSGDHPQIVEALRNSDARRARKLMFDHILSGGDALIETLAQRGL